MVESSGSTGTNWTEFTQTNGAPGRYVVAIESGSDGNVWFGAIDGGLARFDGKMMEPVGAGFGTFIPSGVQKIFRAADGTLWFGTLTGVTHYDGTTWVPLDEGDGLVPGAIGAMAQDAKGAMWFGSANGLIRYDPVAATNPMPARPGANRPGLHQFAGAAAHHRRTAGDVQSQRRGFPHPPRETPLPLRRRSRPRGLRPGQDQRRMAARDAHRGVGMALQVGG